MATYWENSCSFGLRYVLWYKYLIVSLVFSHLGFWSGILFLIAPFPDLCILVPLYKQNLSIFASDDWSKTRKVVNLFLNIAGYIKIGVKMSVLLAPYVCFIFLVKLRQLSGLLLGK